MLSGILQLSIAIQLAALHRGARAIGNPVPEIQRPDGPASPRPGFGTVFSLVVISLKSSSLLPPNIKMSKRKIGPQTGKTIPRPGDVNRKKRPSKKFMAPVQKKARNGAESTKQCTKRRAAKATVKRQKVQHTDDAVCRNPRFDVAGGSLTDLGFLKTTSSVCCTSGLAAGFRGTLWLGAGPLAGPS